MECNKKRVVLINAPIDSRYKDSTSLFCPPLGLMSIKAYLEQKDSAVEVLMLDGMIMQTEEIINKMLMFRPRYVGISIQLLSYKNAIRICRAAKQQEAFVFVGGHHATQMSEKIISRKHSYIDCVVCGDGEIPIYQICSGNYDISRIPGVVLWDDYNQKVHSIPPKLCQLEEFPNPYRAKDIRYERYQHNLEKSSFHNKGGHYYRIYSHKGCRFRAKGSRCVFCGRADEGYRFFSINRFFNNLDEMQLSEKDFVFDVGDDLCGNLDWLKEAVKYKKERNIQLPIMGIFGRGDEVTKESAKYLREFGVQDITIGVESGDNLVLLKTGKEIGTASTFYHAANLLFDNGIGITPSYVLGLPGESKRSLHNTVSHARALYELSVSKLGMPPGEMVANLLEPLPGSSAFEILEKYYPYKYFGEDELEMEMLQKDYFSLVFNLDAQGYEKFRTALREAGKEINQMTGFADPQGWLRNEM